MKDDIAQHEGNLPQRKRPLTLLVLAGCVCWVSYLAIALLSRQFIYGEGFTERPILLVLGLLGLAFFWYLIAIWTAVRGPENRRLLALIIVGSIVFRITLVFSWPIQEIDIYRYLWDGEATTHSVSPFRYSPEQVLDASADEVLPDDLRRLVELRDTSPATAEVLSRVHYGELPTIYPPVSQVVFAFCSLVTPARATVFQRLVIMKGCFVLFDLATLAVVIGLLRLTGRHVGWSIAYGWCPLVLKEIANDGHLDALAVFLTSLAVLIVLRTTFSRAPPRGSWGAVLAAGVLGLAVGAKLYPVVLLPLFVITWIRHFGWRQAVVPTVAFAAVVLVVLWPMFPRAKTDLPVQHATTTDTGDLPPVPEDSSEDNSASQQSTLEPQDPSAGLKAFLGRWEMNDFLFMLVVENIKPDGNRSRAKKAWFVIVPESWRATLADRVAAGVNVRPSSAAFLLARLITSVVFVALALLLAWRAAGSEHSLDWLRAAFLTLAWFWLLSPTQNPWYWIWAMPLLPFARSRAWFAVSGLALIYYLRFWLGYHWPEEPFLGTAYHGEPFFDYVVAWLFAPWFAWLAIDAWRHRRTESFLLPAAEEESLAIEVPK